jgi:excisionase family DNA binding protein
VSDRQLVSEELVSVKQAAVLLDVSVATVRRWAASGFLHAQKVGRDWLIDKNHLDPQCPRCHRPLQGILVSMEHLAPLISERHAHHRTTSVSWKRCPLSPCREIAESLRASGGE